MSSPIKVGALGNARILRRYISNRDINALIDIRLIATRSQLAAQKASVTYPNKIITQNYEEALHDQNLDAIYICLPSALHFYWAKKTLESGKSVLIEKPAVLSIDEAHALSSLARSHNLVVMEAWWYRFHPLVAALKNLLLSNALGAIRLITSSFSYVNSDLSDSRWNADLGGGALNDMFCYHIDFLNHVMGINNDQIELVQAFSQMRHGVDASISAELITKAGTVCQFMAGINRHSMCKTFIVGEKGSIEIPHLRVLPEMGMSKFSHHHSNGSTIHSFEMCDAYAVMFDAFGQAVQNRHSSEPGLEEMIQNANLMSRIRAASQEP
jgi:predicted dehydrogenase